MAKIRALKPEFFTDEKIVDCSPLARLHEFELSAINRLRPTENIAGVCC